MRIKHSLSFPEAFLITILFMLTSIWIGFYIYYNYSFPEWSHTPLFITWFFITIFGSISLGIYLDKNFGKD